MACMRKDQRKRKVRRDVEQVEISGEQSVEKKVLGCHLQGISCLGANRVILLDVDSDNVNSNSYSDINRRDSCYYSA